MNNASKLETLFGCASILADVRVGRAQYPMPTSQCAERIDMYYAAHNNLCICEDDSTSNGDKATLYRVASTFCAHQN